MIAFSPLQVFGEDRERVFALVEECRRDLTHRIGGVVSPDMAARIDAAAQLAAMVSYGDDQAKITLTTFERSELRRLRRLALIAISKLDLPEMPRRRSARAAFANFFQWFPNATLHRNMRSKNE